MDPYQPFVSAAEGYLREALAESFRIDEHFRLEPGGEIADFAFPCFQLAKRIGMRPDEIAAKLAEGASKVSSMLTVAAKGGYLNMDALPDKLAHAAVSAVREMGAAYGRSDVTPSRILVEHTSINPTGPMHIGRTRNAIIGDTLVRTLRQGGHDVSSEYYVNDVGKQVVILYWGISNLMKGRVEGKADHELVRYYIQANELLEKDEKAAAEIRDLQQRLESGDSGLLRETRQAAELVLNGIRESLSSINIIHDRFSFESELIRDGSVRKVIERLKKLPEAAEEKGAWYLPFGSEEKDRFYFTRSDGTSLYTARDISYHLDKLGRADRLVDVLGEDQKLGMTYMTKTLELLGEAKKIEFLYHSFVSMVEGKMSTRHGVGVLLDDVVSEAKRRAEEEVRRRRPDMSEQEMRNIAAVVGTGAVRYNVVRLQAEKKLVFKWEEALNFEGSSAPFVQYSHARACSILDKAGEWGAGGLDYSEENELRLAKQLALFPALLREVARTLAVHRIASYAQQTASEFNQFYRVVPVLKAPPNRLGDRLALVDASRIVLKNALGCMGIDAPATM